jgi:serine/threonine protein phosphatase 1
MENKAIYAIGDIHGMVNKLERLYAKILRDIAFRGITDVTIIFLGDYIDRGPCSKEVLDFLMNLTDTDVIKHIMLFGNHEDMLVTAYYNPDNLAARHVYLTNGGIEGMDSFGYSNRFPTVHDAPEFLPYIKWMESLPVKYKIDNYVFVHGGYDMRVSYDEQSDDVVVWKRTEKNGMIYNDCEYVIVHGHTTYLEPVDYPNEIGVDTGACWGESTELTAVLLTEDHRGFIGAS